MKIAIIGYGKMGHMIEKIALERGNTITCHIDRDNIEDFDSDAFRNSDVAIEFSTPATAVGNLERCFKAKVPVVCGTTGWTSHLDEMKALCDHAGTSMMWASNYSVGVNIFMALNRYLAGIMENFSQYTPDIVEIHHVHKLDHPSGTAISLAEEVVDQTSRLSGWSEPDGEAVGNTTLLKVAHIRRGEVPGTHTIDWESPVDGIAITHTAKSREGFALGAVMAAEWLPGHKGFHTIGEMLNEVTHQNIFK